MFLSERPTIELFGRSSQTRELRCPARIQRTKPSDCGIRAVDPEALQSEDSTIERFYGLWIRTPGFCRPARKRRKKPSKPNSRIFPFPSRYPTAEFCRSRIQMPALHRQAKMRPYLRGDEHVSSTDCMTTLTVGHQGDFESLRAFRTTPRASSFVDNEEEPKHRYAMAQMKSAPKTP